MTSYIVKHKKNGRALRYKRVVPLDVRDALGVRVWSKYLGIVSQRDAEGEARKLAVQHDQEIARVRALSPAERAEAKAHGGIANLEAFATGVERSFAQTASLTLPDDDGAGQRIENTATPQEIEEVAAQARRARRVLRKLDTAQGLTPLVSAWKVASSSMDKHGEDAMHRSVKRLIGVIGDMAPKKVTRDHAAKYRDHLDQLPLAPRTKQKYLEHVQTLFNVALSKRLVDANPFQGIKVTKVRTKFVDEESKDPFEAHHVRAIFDALPGEHPDFQWVTKLAAYHGMRSGEAAQLRKEDVTTTMGVTALSVHDEFGSIKNRDSKRLVPLHPACADFVKYAEAAEGPWIFASFPDWESTGNRRGAPYQRRASDFLRKVVGISSPRLSMHSLRHRWITLAREIDMPLAVSHGIAGHAHGKGEHAKYGGPVSLKKKLQWLKKIDPLE